MDGLACVIALAKLGFKHINIYETAIQPEPNLAKVLDRLGC